MKQKLIEKEAIKIIGLKIRTDNQLEMNPDTFQIAGLFQTYWEKKLADKIKHRVSPGISY